MPQDNNRQRLEEAMATPLKSANTIDFSASNPGLMTGLNPPSMPAASDEQQNLRYHFISRLQSSLELEEIMAQFQETLAEFVKTRGQRYLNEAQRIQLMQGRTGSHSCGYRLMTRQDFLGELVFYRNTRFTDSDLETIESALSALLCPLRNSLLYRQALTASVTDPLTGAGNRAGLNVTLNREIKLAKRYRHALSVLLIDIDKFKAINDNHGHSAGDESLKILVRAIAEISRNTDACYRYGGEEFVVVLNRTDQEGALIIAERLRQHIETMDFQVKGIPLKLTVSIGIASYREEDNADSLFNRADKALYQIKHLGGNRVTTLPDCVATEHSG
ncbi:MAG: GGDEF domain-containing protein [Pseudomonadales bacterium]|nr:GGDEF domain-containing protein [Pseudomonadales bacterium]